MPYDSLLFWAVVAVAVTGGAWLVVQLLVRDAPRNSVRDSARAELERQSTRPAALWGDDAPDVGAAGAFASSIRAQAEEAARAVADGDESAARNPFAEGTRDYVLWLTSYHLALAQLHEQRQGQADDIRS